MQNTEKLKKIKSGRDTWLKTYHNVELYPSQIEMSNAIIDAVMMGNGGEFPVEFSRQSGKTTILVYTVEYLIYIFKQVIGRGIRIGIFAPQKEQAKTDFDRLKDAFFELEQKGVSISYKESNATTLKPETPDGDVKPATLSFAGNNEVYIYPISKTSNPESKTLDLILIEEAQGVDDHKMKTAVFPMGASTNAPRILIGTAGYQICYFYRLLQKDQRFINDYHKIFAERRERYELTGNEEELNYERYVNSEKLNLGEETDEFRSQYKLDWILGSGQFITLEELDKMVGDFSRAYTCMDAPCFAGIDTAKMPDSTVVTILKDQGENKKKLINWLKLSGDNYADQFEIIKQFLSNYKVEALAIDATGQGDFMPDMFERNTNWQNDKSGLYRVKFSLSSKDIIYKQLAVVCREFLTTIPRIETKEAEEFRQQMLDLQKEYKGEFLSCHHPDESYAHDDYCDSWALAEYAYAEYNKNNQIGVTLIGGSEEKKAPVDFLEDFDDEFFN